MPKKRKKNKGRQGMDKYGQNKNIFNSFYK